MSGHERHAPAADAGHRSGAADIASPRLVRDYLRRLQSDRDIATFDAGVLRSRSVPARELIAWHASGQRLGLQSILSLAWDVEAGDENATESWRRLDPRGLARLARVIALQVVYPGDIPSAYAIYRSISRVQGARAIPNRHLVLMAQLALAVQDFSLAVEVTGMLKGESLDRRYLMCDLANPFGGSPHASSERWLTRLNELIQQSGAEPLQFGDDISVSPFDRIACALEPATVDGPLVTVAIASWQPDHTLRTAVQSILAQTWRNLEVLLIDDASPEQYQGIYAEIAALDPRIRLIRQERNSGTYVARNRALSEARGEYFTVHDSDDWAHPRRIEAQVRAMADGVVASQCTGIRADDLMRFNFPGVPAYRTNESSLLFAVGPVREAMGFYDPSRKGADSEFSTRLRRVFGHEAFVVLPEILTVIRLSPNSLSRSEFRAGWRHPARVAYRRNFEAWHGRTTDMRLDPKGHSRKFPLPRRFHLGHSPRTESFDFAFFGDLRQHSPLAVEAADEIVALANPGKPTAIIQADSFLRLSRHAVEPFPHPVEQALRDGIVEEIELGDSVAIDTLVILEPDLLQFLNPQRASLNVRRVVLVAATGPIATDGLLAYRAEACEEVCLQVFGCNPEWLARDEVAAGQIGGIAGVRGTRLRCWPETVAAPHWWAPLRQEVGLADSPKSTAIGFQVDIRLELEAQLQHYAGLNGPTVGVWLHDPQGLVAPGLPDWNCFGPHSAEKATFLAQLDVWLKLEPASGHGTLPRDVLQSMAAGCIPLLDPSWQVQFGPAAAYATATDALEVAHALLANPEQRSAFLERGRAFVEERAGAAAFREKVHLLLNP